MKTGRVVSKTGKLKPHTVYCMHQVVVLGRAHQPLPYNCVTIKWDESLTPYNQTNGMQVYMGTVRQIDKLYNKGELKFLARNSFDKPDSGP